MSKIINYALVNGINHLGYTSFDYDLNMYSKGAYIDGKEVLRYYDEKFPVLNASYINLSGDREFAKANLHKASLVIQHLNNWMTEDDLRRWIRGKIKRFHGETLIKSIEASRLAKQWFGEEIDTSSLITYTSVQWKSSYPLDNPYSIAEEPEKYFSYVVKRRQKFSLSCHNKVKSGDSLDKYYAAYDTIENEYGYVTITDVATLMGVTVESAGRIKRKADRISKNTGKPPLLFTNKKYVDTQKKIVSSGESVHYEDRDLITKQRVHIKSKVGRPTINSHWKDVEDYFEELNKMLEDGNGNG